MTPVSLGDSTYLHFGTSSASTGAATDADSTPTVFVAEDGVALAYAPTVTNITTGLYMVQIDATAGNGFEAGRRYSVYVVATVGGVTGRDGIGEFEVLAVDLNASLDAAVSSRMATYAQPAGFLAATFPAAIPTANENADALIARNIEGGSSTGRTVAQALAFLRNKWSVSGGTLTVYAADDSATSWTAAVTQTAGNPVSAVDPA